MKNLAQPLLTTTVFLLIGIFGLVDAIKTHQASKITCAAFALVFILALAIALARHISKLRAKQQRPL
jgi:nitrogen fixation/metabolism regulation signal transduction histidine kinase